MQINFLMLFLFILLNKDEATYSQKIKTKETPRLTYF